MSIRVRESDVEKYLVKRMAAVGIPCIKFHPDDMTGMPDRIALLQEGKVIWIELKTENGRLSAIQQYRHKTLTDAGQQVYVVWDKADADNLIDRIKGYHGNAIMEKAE